MKIESTPHLIPPIAPMGKVSKAKTKKKSEFQEILDKIDIRKHDGQSSTSQKKA